MQTKTDFPGILQNLRKKSSVFWKKNLGSKSSQNVFYFLSKMLASYIKIYVNKNVQSFMITSKLAKEILKMFIEFEKLLFFMFL